MREDETRSRKLAKALRKKLTDAEHLLWSKLRRHPIHKFRRQHPIGPYVADFACVAARLVIELDGDSHEVAQEHDRKRDAYLSQMGWRVVRILNRDVYKNLEGVVASVDLCVNGEDEIPPPPATRAPPP